jgi:hypothetical protein
MPSFIRQGASVTASILETAAGALRKLSDTEAASQPSRATEPERAPEPMSTPEPAKTRPAAGTRTRISNPKAARKVRSRQG